MGLENTLVEGFDTQMKKTVNSEPSSKQKSQKFIMVSKDDILKLETSSKCKGMDMQKEEASFSYKKEEKEVFVSEEDEVYLNKDEHDDISGDDNFTDQEQQENTEDNEDLIQDIFKMEKNHDRNVNNIQIVTIDDVLESENRKSISKKIVLTVDDVLAMKPRGKKSKSENEMQLFACEICNNVFSGRKKLKMHKIRIHNPDWETKYKCHICGLKCKTMSAHSHHLSKHANKRYNCDRCEKTYVSKSKVREHILRIHEKKMDNKYLCPECGKGFKFSNALEYHMKKHTNSKNYKCRYCDFASIALGGLKRHERTHTGERPYQCKYCEKTFAGVAERQKHEHSHEGVYPYSCQYCDKQFIQTYNMKVHWMQHSGPYLCDVCKRSFAGADILKFHYAHSHKIKNVIIEEEDEDIV